MQIDRDEALELVRRRMPVLTTGGGRPAREVRSLRDLPPEPGDDYDGPPLEYHRLRDDSGNWTRAGMEHAIRSGGSVMHRGTVITRIEDLPDAEEMAAGEQTRLRAEAERIDAQIAELAARRSHLARQGEEAAAAAKRTRDAQRGERLQDDMNQSGESKMVAAGEGQPAQPQPGPQPQAAQPQPGPQPQAAQPQPGRAKKQ